MTRRTPKADAAGSGFEIWQSARGVHSERNPVRIAILAQLGKGPRTLGDLAKATSRSKSTLSALHVPALQSAGLLSESEDPSDARVKWYRLEGSRLGSSTVDPTDLRAAVLEFVRQRGLVPLAPLLEVVDPAALVASGKPEYVAAVATRLGLLVGRMLTATTPKERLAELSGILDRHGLGTLAGTPSLPTAKAPKALHGFVLALAKSALPSPGS